MKSHGNKEFWLATLRSEVPAFRAAAIEAGPRAPVPTCPEWTVAELIGHLTQWVGTHVGRGVASPPEQPQPREPVTATVEEFDAAFADLLTLFDGLDPELPAWNWAPQAKKAAFWQRRVAHDTALHRWDAQMAAAGLTDPIEAKLAADIISEVLDTVLPAGDGRGAPRRQGMVALSATDLGQTWHMRLREHGGVALLDTDTLFDDHELHERVVAAGSASDLALALWGRLGFDVLTVSGDTGLLECLRVG